MAKPLWHSRDAVARPLQVLLIGPYDPLCGEYTFLAPPLGVWRLAGFIESLGHVATVFDPNCCEDEPERLLTKLLRQNTWDVVGVSTTGMTLRYDLSLAHLVHASAPTALLVAGGMEATFNPELLFSLAPIDLIVLGEGEKPLRDLFERLRTGAPLIGVPGTAVRLETGGAQRFHSTAMSYRELRSAIALTPYERMPYEAYWRRLEAAYSVDGLPFKAEREARLAEIRSVRLITLNYCPMACAFCSSTNFLHAAQGSTAKIARLEAGDCIDMIVRIVAAQPRVKTIIFQDDIFVFTQDKRIRTLCEEIIRSKQQGTIPAGLQFISTNRIDAMTVERLALMKRAGFRVVGFGIESFSKSVLAEFNKLQIHKHIEPVLSAALGLGMTPFLDLILSSPRSSVADIAETAGQAHRWMTAGCEVGLYPYVVPFSGAQMAKDAALAPYTTTRRQTIPGTDIAWPQPEHILPIDRRARSVVQRIVASYEQSLPALTAEAQHVPSRVRSLLWVACAMSVLQDVDACVPHPDLVLGRLRKALASSRSDVDAPRSHAPAVRVA